MPANDLSVAIAQIDAIPGAIDVNAQAHYDMIAEARTANAQVLVFPELSLTGYGLGRSVFDLALPADATLLTDLASAAGPMATVVGFVEEAGLGVFYNSVAILRFGVVSTIHRKINLPTYGGLEEGKWFHAGSTPTLCGIADRWTAGHLICADMWDPVLVHRTLIRRPDILCVPVNSATGIVSDGFSNERNWDLAARFYAMIYGTPLILANRCGAEGGSHFWGGSAIYDPRGEKLVGADDGPQLITAKLNRRAIAEARFDLPTLRDSTDW